MGDALRDAVRVALVPRGYSELPRGQVESMHMAKGSAFALRSLPELFPDEDVLLVRLRGAPAEIEEAIASLKAAGLDVTRADTSFELHD